MTSRMVFFLLWLQLPLFGCGADVVHVHLKEAMLYGCPNEELPSVHSLWIELAPTDENKAGQTICLLTPGGFVSLAGIEQHLSRIDFQEVAKDERYTLWVIGYSVNVEGCLSTALPIMCGTSGTLDFSSAGENLDIAVTCKPRMTGDLELIKEIKACTRGSSRPAN